MCTKIVLLNMTKLQENSSNNILSIRSEHYALPATIKLKPITHLLVLMLIGGNVGDDGEQGKRECMLLLLFLLSPISYHGTGWALIDNCSLEKPEEKKRAN